MRITKLHVTDFRCFDELLLDDLERFVCLVGANGTGKSSILDLIMMVCGAEDGWNKFQRDEWEEDPEDKILKIDIRFTPEEIKEFGIPPRISPPPDIRSAGIVDSVVDHRGDRTFSAPDTSDIKRIKGQLIYYYANRSFNLQATTNLESRRIGDDFYRQSGATNFQSRADRLSFQLANLLVQREHEWAIRTKESKQPLDRDDFKGLEEVEFVFDKFLKLSGKEFANAEFSNGFYSFFFNVPWSDEPVSLSKLSSGEQWLLLFFTEMELFKWRNHIILIDEIETHLHPKLAMELIDVLKERDDENQYWFTTHSPMISRHLRTGVYGLVLNQTTYKSEKIEYSPHAFDLFDDLAGGEALIPSAKTIVLLEGQRPLGYRYALDRLFFRELQSVGAISQGIDFVSVGHSSSVAGYYEYLQEFQDQVEAGWTIYAIRDRDALPSKQREEMIINGKGNFWVWELGSLEGYLIEPVLLRQYFESIPLDSIPSDTQIESEILEILGRRVDMIVTRYENQLVLNSYPKRSRATIKNLANIQAIQTTLQSEVDNFKLQVQHYLAAHQWKELLPYVRCRDVLCSLFDKFGVEKPVTSIATSNLVTRMMRDVVKPQLTGLDSARAYLERTWPEIAYVMKQIRDSQQMQHNWR